MWDSVTGFFKDVYGKASDQVKGLEESYKKHIREYQDEAYEMAKKIGYKVDSSTGHNDELDAFRHAYASAKVFQDSEFLSKYGGIFHEVKGQLKDVFSRDPKNSQPVAESLMDIHNNRIGRDIGMKVGDKAEKEELAREVHRALQKGKMVTQPPTATLPSILDYYSKIKR